MTCARSARARRAGRAYGAVRSRRAALRGAGEPHRDAGQGEGPAVREVFVAENIEIAAVEVGGRQPAMIGQPRGAAMGETAGMPRSPPRTALQW